VHGPYTATLLVDHFLRRQPDAGIAKIAFRARRPLFEGEPVDLCGRITPVGAELWARGRSGEMAMTMDVGAASGNRFTSNG
jgi:3-methylfumaryl-CoA hydratase